jgi:hypothetical protein
MSYSHENPPLPPEPPYTVFLTVMCMGVTLGVLALGAVMWVAGMGGVR